jgi:hypothetical protein
VVTDTSPPRTDRRELALDLGLLTLATILLRIPAYLAVRHLTFDDGVYGASAMAMRHGGIPFRDVFSSQGPLFLPLVRLADLIGLQTLNAPRLLAVASGVVLVLGVYACGREVGDRTGALLAAGLTATAGSVLWVTGPLASDGPALAFSVLALWQALRYRRSPGLGRAAIIGIAAGAALSVKFMAAPVLVPVAWLLLEPLLDRSEGSSVDHPPDRSPVTTAVLGVVVAGVAAGVVFLLPSLAYGLSKVWDQSVHYHTQVAGARQPLHNLSKILGTLFTRDLVLMVFAALAAGAFLLGQVRPSTTPEPAGLAERRSWWRHPSSHLLLWAWLTATVLLLLWTHPLWRPHVSGLVPALALLVGAYRPPTKAIVVTAVLLVPVGIWRVSDYVRPTGLSPAARYVNDTLQQLPAGAQAISDDPGLVWRAGRQTPDDLVDTSLLRIQSGRITSESLARAAADNSVCAVVVWSGARFGSFTDLSSRLAAAGYQLDRGFGGPRALYLRRGCNP